MRKWNWKLLKPSFSIKAKIFWSFVLVALIPSLAIGISAYYISSNLVTQKVSASIEQTVEYIGGTLDRELKDIKNYSDYIFADEDLQQTITDYKAEPHNSIVAEKRFLAKLNNYMSADAFQQIRVIKFWGNNGYTQEFGDFFWLSYYDDALIKESSLWKEAMSGSSRMRSAGTGRQLLKCSAQEIPTWSLMRAIRDPYFKNNIGGFYMSVDLEMFQKLVRRFNVNGVNYYIIDENGTIINEDYSEDNKKIIVGLKNQIVRQSDVQWCGRSATQLMGSLLPDHEEIVIANPRILIDIKSITKYTRYF